MKSSTLARTFELAKLAAQVGLKEFKSGDLNSRVEQAVMIVNSLSQLKGAAMKVGQLLSLDLDNYFPPEAIAILSQLQNAAVARPFDEIRQVIDSELDETHRIEITSIDKMPVGVASIGQVHKARYKNREIVLKVQFENLSKSIDSDLKTLKALASSFCQITGRKMNIDPLFKEFKSILEQELDYTAEAQFQTEFKHKIEQLNRSSKCQYRVPAIIPELSSKNLLAMDFESGLTLRHWFATKPSPDDKKQIAVAILDLYFHEFFEWGMVQTDPNWGNFLIDRRDLKLSVCLLDFGATRSYSPEFIKNYISLLQFAAEKKSKELQSLAIKVGLIDSRESEAAFGAFEEMLSIAIKPFFVRESGSTYFDFSDQNHSLDSQNAAKHLSQELVYSRRPMRSCFCIASWLESIRS